MFKLIVLPLVIAGTLSAAKTLPQQYITCKVPYSLEYCAQHQLKVVTDNGSGLQQHTYNPQ